EELNDPTERTIEMYAAPEESTYDTQGGLIGLRPASYAGYHTDPRLEAARYNAGNQWGPEVPTQAELGLIPTSPEAADATQTVAAGGKTSGYVSPYAGTIAAIKQRMSDIENAPSRPMYAKEELAARQAQNDNAMLWGMALSMTPDAQSSQVGGMVLR